MYETLDIKKTTGLYLLKQGWFATNYLLTDEIRNFGEISFRRFSWYKATAITAAAAWSFQREGIFSRTILITGENGASIGSATRDMFSRKTILQLQSGFLAEFYRPSIWAREYVWESESYGKIMHITSCLFSMKDSVCIDQSMAPPAFIPLLIFLGEYLVILSRRRRTRH